MKLQIIRFADLPEPEPLDTSQAIPRRELSWVRILDEEPEVAGVFADLYSFPVRERWRLYPQSRLCKLVGWRARNPRLRSEAAYRMAMDRMWELLL
jgi:hypothetical protein